MDRVKPGTVVRVAKAVLNGRVRNRFSVLR